jgi:type VI secretion system protein ImpH
MANPSRTPADSVTLEKALAETPHRFDFFQALRRLECLHAENPRLGRSLRAADDPIRLTQRPSLAFAPATIAAFETGRPPRMAVDFLGLLGPHGPLPLHLTDYARDRLRNENDPTFVRFLDIFHHRMLSLFYRAWANTQPTVSFDRSESDRFADYVGSLFGLGMASLRNRDATPDEAKLHYAGWLSSQPRNAEGLQAILADFFRLPVAIEQFVGHWLVLPEECQCRLAESPETGTLGMAATIGSRVWDCQHKFRIVFGPLSLADYQRLLPSGDSLRRLVAWVRNYLGDELIWDMHLLLKKEEAPPLRLGSETARLGWTSWLCHRALTTDADDLYLDPLTALTSKPLPEGEGLCKSMQ